MEARPNQEKAKSVEEKEKKITMKETTKSLVAELEAMPVEVLVKIFNFLPNSDIRCGVSLTCTKFYEICQNESLVPVKDLCIYGHPDVDGKSKKNSKQCVYSLRNIRTVIEKIVQSKNLTSLKIKALTPENVNELVSMALQNCPKLTHLEIIETNLQIGEYFEYMLSFQPLIPSHIKKFQIWCTITI